MQDSAINSSEIKKKINLLRRQDKITIKGIGPLQKQFPLPEMFFCFSSLFLLILELSPHCHFFTETLPNSPHCPPH